MLPLGWSSNSQDRWNFHVRMMVQIAKTRLIDPAITMRAITVRLAIVMTLTALIGDVEGTGVGGAMLVEPETTTIQVPTGLEVVAAPEVEEVEVEGIEDVMEEVEVEIGVKVIEEKEEDEEMEVEDVELVIEVFELEGTEQEIN